MIKRYKNKTIARKTKVRAKLKRFGARPRLSVFRSQKFIYAQIIDDQKGETLVAASEKELKKPSKTKIKRAFQVGEILAQKALKKKTKVAPSGIKQVYFDRGQYKYHGRIKSLIKGARKAGLNL